MPTRLRPSPPVRAVLLALCVVAGAALVLVSPIIWLAMVDPFGGGAHPTDAALLAQFREKRAVLEQLVAMTDQDRGLQRVGPDFTRPEQPETIGISADRIALYRRRCIEAGIAEGLSRYGQGVTFLVHARGLGIAGSSKGFVHRVGADDDATIVDGDLDAAVAAVAVAKTRGVLLRRLIEGNWWLELDMR